MIDAVGPALALAAMHPAAVAERPQPDQAKI